ncbi:bifunctional L-3-cyanoalanine synthase/cysteine synthase 1, mitochondrial [Tanacetum coccineum]|uniref:Bifunctional L-3-cyanoalanine synthase/cysteine synthase 1, mitochondrial n=1 Tax=Tanacetum coccineum TaxID=301880 RepID=A0ABQ5I9M0_9ASTR
MAGTFTKKKKCVTIGVYVDVPGMVWKCTKDEKHKWIEGLQHVVKPSSQYGRYCCSACSISLQMLAQLCLMFRTNSEGFEQQESSTTMVTEVVASKSQHEQDSPKNISKKMEAQYSNVSSNNAAEDEKPHSTSRSTSTAMVVYDKDMSSTRESYGHGEWQSDLLGCCSEPEMLTLSMMNDAEEKELFTPGKAVLIEHMSGNMGISITFMAALKVYRILLIGPSNASLERRVTMRAYDLLENTPDSFMLQQFSNPANNKQVDERRLVKKS